MESVDLNLIAALDALLAENSVTTAAARLHTSVPAMSRTLGRLRRVFDDPLLVRAGRELVPTPRALELRGEAHAVAARARALFDPSPATEPASMMRTFDLQITDVLSTTFTPALIENICQAAPRVSLRLRPESIEDLPALREGLVDIEVGDVADQDPEIRSEPLVTDALVAVVRADHPVLNGPQPMTPALFAAIDHVAVSRRGQSRGPVDDRLAELGLRRRVAATLPSFAA